MLMTVVETLPGAHAAKRAALSILADDDPKPHIIGFPHGLFPGPQNWTLVYASALFIFLGSTAERITALPYKGREFISKLNTDRKLSITRGKVMICLGQKAGIKD